MAKRIWASLERDTGEVIAEAMLEAERHDPERAKRWVVLVDGAETQLDLVEAGAAAYGVDVTVALDIIHVVEYVWKAPHVFHRDGSLELACWAWTRVRDILEGKAKRVAPSMRRAATVADIPPDTRKPVDAAALPAMNEILALQGERDRIVVSDGALSATRDQGRGLRTNGLLMAYKLVAMAQRRWRRLSGAYLLPLVRAGVVFVDGVIQTSLADGGSEGGRLITSRGRYTTFDRSKEACTRIYRICRGEGKRTAPSHSVGAFACTTGTVTGAGRIAAPDIERMFLNE